MLLRLVPGASLPTILFTLAFPALPPYLPLPAAWDAHLRLLADTQLPAPPALHALDRSIAWAGLLESVSFDLATLTVTCTFIDGSREEWPLPGRCIRLLDSVVRDVTRSAREAAREQHPAPPLPPPSPPPPGPKPKKRRSVLAAFVASLVPSSSPPPSPTSPLPPPPPPPSPLPLLPVPLRTGPPLSVLLRRRARSTLVDAFRRFVAAELRPPHYAEWAARSTARRAAAEMARLIDDAIHNQDPHPATDPLQKDRQTDDDDDSASSSVHTPLDYHDPTPASALPAAPPIVLPSSTYNTYLALRALHNRAVDLSERLSRDQEREADVDRSLEVRSARRAWSAGLCRGAAALSLVLGAPMRRSPLWRSWTQDAENERERQLGEESEFESHLRTRPAMRRRARSLCGEGEERAKPREWLLQGTRVKSREAEDVYVLPRDAERRLGERGGEQNPRLAEQEEVDEDDADTDEEAPHMPPHQDHTRPSGAKVLLRPPWPSRIVAVHACD